MKKILLLLTVLSFGYTTESLANENSIEISYFKKKKLCRSWYVTKAFQTREDKPTRDRSKKANGSSFTFNKDNSFILMDASRRNRETMNGTWEETGKNSISVKVDDVELNFVIEKLTKDSLYIIGTETRRTDRKMHIVFTSNYIKPREEQQLSYDDLEEVEISESVEIVEETEEMVTDVEVPKQEEKVEPNYYNKQKLTKEWILTDCHINGRNVTKEYVGTSYNFGNDLSFTLLEFHKKNNPSSMGIWNFEDNKLVITKDNITTRYTITKLTDDNLKLREVGSSNYSVYSFKAKK